MFSSRARLHAGGDENVAFDIFRAWRRLECRYKKSIGSARFSYQKSSRSRSGGGGSTRHKIKYPRQVLYLFASTFDYRLKICEEGKSSFDHQFPRLGKLLFDDSHSASEFDSSARVENKTRKERKSLGDQHKFARWFMGRSAPLANVCIEQAKKEKKFNFRRGFNLWSRYSLSLGSELQLKCSEWKDEFSGSDRKWKITFECMICYGVDEELKPELVVEASNVY